jgi:periplasmic divalent cation tolerance protein
MLFVVTTVPNMREGELLAGKILDSKLAACVQILPKMTSVYLWEGKVQRESEHLLVIKTTEELYPELERFITKNHSYDVPEIVAVDSAHVSRSYREWLEQTLSK